MRKANKLPRVKQGLRLRRKSPRYSRPSGSTSLFTASLHPRVKNPRYSRSLNKENFGFTLIELLIVMALMTLLAGGLLTLQFILTQNQIVVWQSYISVNEANNNIFTLVRELRTARNAENGAYAIESAEDNELVFYSDFDYDGQAEKIRYTLAGNVLTKGFIEPVGFPVSYPANEEKAKVISDNVRNDTEPLFYYYDENWPADSVNNPLSTPANTSDIKLVRIYLRINTVVDQPDKDYILESYSQIRSLKENL